MPQLHPMYKDPASLPVREQRWLRQGDIIGLDQLISGGALDGHQEYIKQRPEFFCGFCVLTQTCDLVRETKEDARNKKKPRQPVEFIALSLIRRLTHVFNKNDTASDSARNRTREYLKRIANHDWDKHRPYFFLHQEPAANIGGDWIVDLRTFFSLVSEYHYDQVLDARLLCLDDVYANKLGWMAGYMFSRVAVREWEDFDMKKTREQFADSILKQIEEKSPTPIHEERKKVVSRLRKLSRLTPLLDLSEDELKEVLESAKATYGSKVPQ